MNSPLQQRHEDLLARQDALTPEEAHRGSPATDQLLGDARQFVTDAVAQSDTITDPRERDILRAYLRYWATFIYEYSGVFPKTDLRPADLTGYEAPPPPPVMPDERPADAKAPSGCAAPLRGIKLGWVLGLIGLLLVLGLCAVVLIFVPFSRNQTGDPSDGTPIPGITNTAPVTRTVSPTMPDEADPIGPHNVAQLAATKEITAHTGGALAVAFDPQAPELATTGADGHVRFWILPDLAPGRVVDVGRGWLRTVDYSPYGGRSGIPALLLTGGNDRRLWVYDLESLQMFAEYAPAGDNSGFVFAARFSPDGRFFASGHGDGAARIWDVAGGTENQSTQGRVAGSRLGLLPSGGTAVNDVAYGRDGATLALASSAAETGVQVVDSTLTRSLCAIDTGPALAVAAWPAGDLLAAGLGDGRLLFVTAILNSCRIVAELPAAHAGGVTDIAFSPGGEWLVTGGRDGTLKFWSVDGELLATLTTVAPVEAVAVDPDSRYVASALADGSVILWSVPAAEN